MECCAGPAVPCDCNPRGRMPPGFKVHCVVNDEEEAEQKAVLNLELPAFSAISRSFSSLIDDGASLRCATYARTLAASS